MLRLIVRQTHTRESTVANGTETSVLLKQNYKKDGGLRPQQNVGVGHKKAVKGGDQS